MAESFLDRRIHARHADTSNPGFQMTPAKWTQTAEFQAATATADTNPSETIRQLVREWVDEHKETTK